MLEDIQVKILSRQFEFSKHAVDQSIFRDITVIEVEQAISSRCEVIENYPDDKYGPSCLILGFTDAGRPLHIQCSYPSRPLIKIITLYQPGPEFWIDHRIRRTNLEGDKL
jgi:hypothetical protein